MLAGASLFTSCDDPNTQEPPQEEPVGPDSPQKPEEPTDSTVTGTLFEIELTGLNATGVNMRVVPVDYEGGYYFDVLRTDNYEYCEANGWQDFIDYTVASIAENNLMTVEEVLKGITSFGADEWTFMGLNQNTDYYAVVMGIDSVGKLCTEIVSEVFHTPDVEMSENTFEITITNETYDGADYTVIPSDKEEYYFSCIVSKVVADQYNVDEALAAYCMSIFPDVNAMLSKGDISYENEGMCQPGRDFYVVAFGYDSGVITTPVAKKSFSTITDGDPSTCEFTFEIGKVTHDEAHVAVTPSNQYNVFFMELIRSDDLEFFKQEYNSEDLQEVMGRFWKEEFLPMISMDMGAAQFVDMVCIWGGLVGGTDHMTFSFLSMETEYIAWAVCLDAEGNPVSDFYFSEPFTTENEIISSATSDIEILGYFDGSELEGEYHNDGFAVVVCSITPSDDAVTWYSDLFAGDLSESSRRNHIKNLTEYSISEQNTRLMIKIAYWDTPCSALSVAQDADGNYGMVDCEVMYCDESRALPADKFTQYLDMLE